MEYEQVGDHFEDTKKENKAMKAQVIRCKRVVALHAGIKLIKWLVGIQIPRRVKAAIIHKCQSWAESENTLRI